LFAAANITATFWSVAGVQPYNPENEPFLDWLLAAGNMTDVPKVFSVSYGDDEPGVNADYGALGRPALL
jgi:hypothetical protein